MKDLFAILDLDSAISVLFFDKVDESITKGRVSVLKERGKGRTGSRKDVEMHMMKMIAEI